MKLSFTTATVCTLSLLCGSGALAEDVLEQAEAGPIETKPKNKKSPAWIDNSHLYVTEQSDNLVRWFDGFFGTPGEDLEIAASFLRVRFDHEWDEETDGHFGVRLRGKVNLPQIDKRLGLIFSDESGDTDGQGDTIEQALSDNNPKNDVALQYTSIDSKRSRLDFKLGFRSGLKVKLAARYRYKQELPFDVLGQFTEELYFRDGEGFGTFTRFDFNRSLEGEKLLRWSNRFNWGQETRGVEWGSTLSLARRINNVSGVSYFINIEGDTRPNYTNKGYGLGATYRRNFMRRWLFFEVEPAYVWRRNIQDPMPGVVEPFYEDRDGVAQLTLRLEILFGKDQLQAVSPTR